MQKSIEPLMMCHWRLQQMQQPLDSARSTGALCVAFSRHLRPIVMPCVNKLSTVMRHAGGNCLLTGSVLRACAEMLRVQHAQLCRLLPKRARCKLDFSRRAHMCLGCKVGNALHFHKLNS